MKRICLFWLMLGWLLQLHAEKLVVAAGESFKIESLDITDIRSIYTAKRVRLGNIRIIPLNLSIDNPLRYRFEHEILNEDRDNLANYWLQSHYLGNHPPKVFKSSEMAAEFLSKVDNSLGYLDEETAQKYHLKILFRAKE